MTRPIGLIVADHETLELARRLAVGGRHVLYYMLGSAPRHHLAPNIEAASTLADLGFDCDIVLSFVDDTTAFRELLIGTPDRLGLGAEMNPGAILVDFGVRPPRETQALLGITGTRGVAILDAALIGTTPSDLGRGTPTILVGGYIDSVDLVTPVLERLGRVDRTGALGSAHTAAALMGYMEAAHRVAHDEAQAVGRALGLSNELLARVLDTDARHSAPNIVNLANRTRLALKIAQDRGISAEIIDFTGARLAEHASRT